jgi:hypothetical protein
MMHAVPATADAAMVERLRCPPLGGLGAAPTAHLDPAELLRDICDCMFIIGHDGARVHAELAMTFDLHERLMQFWEEHQPEPPALHLVA